MENALFPVVDLPEITDDSDRTETFKPSVYFDFKTGDFALDGAHRMVIADGREAYMQWCEKVICTEREACLAYSSNIGVEFDVLSTAPDRETRESMIESTITDALMVHVNTESVGDFVFEHTADTCFVSFTVKGFDWEEERMTMDIPERK